MTIQKRSTNVIGAAGVDNTLPDVPEWYGLLTTAGVAVGAYHGYKRNNSVGWAIGWALLGGAFPFITIPVALAQGIGKRK